MRPYLQLLALLALALLGAFAWRYLAADPGYVLLTFAGWSLEASLLSVLLLAGLGWLLLRVLILLLAGPFRLLRRRRRHKARERLAGGLIALEQGQLLRAEKLLRRAAGDRVQRAVALLSAAEAASRRDDAEAAAGYRRQLAECDPPGLGALVEARTLLAAGQPEAALAVLGPEGSQTPPAAGELRARALAASGRAAEALLLLPGLRRQLARERRPSDALERELSAEALQQSRDAVELDAVWDALPRSARRTVPVLLALCGAARRLGRDQLAVSELERTLDKHWDDALAAQWGRLEHGDPKRALQRAERWLQAHGESSGVLLSLGHLCHREQLWGKAEDFLQRALAGRPAEAWEALGALYAGQNDHGRAQQALRNALATTRGELALPVRALLAAPVEETVPEQRSSMGLPQLPASRAG